VQVAVHRLPAVYGSVDIITEAVTDALGDLLLVAVYSMGACISQ
jgi:hypothetical protein